MSARAAAAEVDRGVLHRDLAAHVPVDPLDERVLLGDGPLRDEVVDVLRPVLHGRVADLRVRLGDDLDDGGVEGVRRVDRRGAPLDVVELRPAVRDDQRPLELADVARVDAEVGLERDPRVDARGYVDEAAARPDRRVQRGELVVVVRHDPAEVLAEDLGVLLERRVGVGEDDPLLLEVLADLVVDGPGVVLGPDAPEVVPLGLGDPQPLEGVLDVGREVLPAPLRLALVERVRIVGVGVKVDLLERGAPVRHRAVEEVLEGAEPVLPHPLRLVLELGDLLDDASGEPSARPDLVGLGVLEVVAGVVERSDLGGRLRHELSGNSITRMYLNQRSSRARQSIGGRGARTR